ncbi:MAG: hypothetical protein U0989_09090 [Azonexus sp.]|nr:hypothetical protein [Azonexus sp.]MDP3638900.1 hypothetical protein [Azonexus sp.]MDZ4314905.1 hypothetical protein [Azonexus sp.]
MGALDQSVENAEQAAAHMQPGHRRAGKMFGRFVDMDQFVVEQRIAPAAAGPLLTVNYGMRFGK